MAEQLAGFLILASGKKSFHQSHISLYAAILLCYNKSCCQNPFRISRRELMRYAAIRSFATYHKCMSDFNEQGLIKYAPSYHPSLASRITLVGFKVNG